MPRFAVLPWFGAFTLAFGIVMPHRTEAAIGDCGQPVAAGPVAVDALEVLRTALGSSDCGGHDDCICDVNGSASITASDALTVLRKAVGQNVSLDCPCGETTTTTTGATTTSTLPPVLDTKELHLLQKIAGTYAAADLAGAWELNVLATGPKAPFWARGEITIAADGTFSGSVARSGGGNTALSGTLTIAADGAMTCTSGCDPAFGGALDAGKTVFIALNTDANGTGLLYVATRKGSGYVTADLAGTWRLASFVSGNGVGRWSIGTTVIDANGAVSITSVDSDGTDHTVDETYNIDGDGFVTCSGGCRPDFRGVLDAGKTIIVTTSKNPDGSAKLNVLTRQDPPYAQADLTAAWAWTTFAAGPGVPPLWSRGPVVIAADGALSGILTDSEGTESSATGKLSIAAGGVITSTADEGLRCSLDSDRTVIACLDSR
jgi:hypothetical protein